MESDHHRPIANGNPNNLCFNRDGAKSNVLSFGSTSLAGQHLTYWSELGRTERTGDAVHTGRREELTLYVTFT